MFFDKKKYEEARGEEELEELFKQATKKGAVLALFHFDAHGKDREAVKASLVDFIARLTKEPGVLYCKGEIEDTIEREGIYSSCSEVKVLGESFSALLNLAMRYGPIAIEILAPEEVRLDTTEAQNVLLDASQTSHEYAKYILERVAREEDRMLIQEKLRRRTEFGKRLIEKSKWKESHEDGGIEISKE